jgi:adhesin/invasin
MPDRRGRRPVSSLATAFLRSDATLTRAGSLIGAVVLVGLAVLHACEKVSVTGVDVAAVRVEPAEANVSLGETLRLHATPLDVSGNPIPGRPVLWISQNNAVATVDSTGLVEARSPGEAQIRASSEGVQGTATVVVPEARRVDGERSGVVAEPSSVPADGVAASTVTVTLRDDQGDLILDARTIALSVAEGIGTLAPSPPTFDPGTGAYSASLTSVTAGTATIVTVADGVTLDDQPRVAFVPGELSAGQSLVEANPSRVNADGVEAATIRVTLRDAQGNLIRSQQNVSLSVVTGPGSLGAVSFSSGTSTYSASLTSTTTGTATVRAVANGTTLTQQAVVQFVASAVSAGTSSAVAAPGTATADGQDASIITVRLRDAQGNLITEPVPVNLLIASGPGALSTGSPAFNSGTNSYTASLTSTQSGTTTIAAVADGVTLNDRPVVTFVAGPVSPDESSLAAAPTRVEADGSDAATLTVTLRDAQGTLITSEQDVSLAVVSGPGTLGGISFASGTSTYSATLTSTTTGVATIQAQANGTTLTEQAAVEFVVGGVSPTESTASAAPETVTADGSSASTVTVQLRDGGGNPVSGLTNADFSVALTGTAAATAVAQTGTVGTYQFDVTSTTPGMVTVTVTASGVTLDDRPQVRFVVGAVSPDESSLTADPTEVEANGSDASTLTVTLRDAQGNLITDEQDVSLAVVSGPGVLGEISFDSEASTYSATLTSTTEGAATIEAEANGTTLTQQAVVEFVGGGASTVESI